MKKKRYLSYLLITILLIAGPFLGASAIGGPDTTTSVTATETALLRKFEKLVKQMDPAIKTSTLAGSLRISDLQSKVKNEAPLPIVFSKRDGSFYYRLGAQETINANGLYLQIDHQTRQVALSVQKAVYNTDGMKTFADLAGHMKEDGYKISSATTGNLQTISFVNEDHVSCKEYAITFDKTSLSIKRVFIRLSEPTDPSNSKKGKIVDLRVSTWSRQAQLSSYLIAGKVVHQVKGVWKLTDGYKSYHLIKI